MCCPDNLSFLVDQGQAQECLLEKSMLDNRKSFLVARISAQVGTHPASQVELGSGARLVSCRHQ